MSTRKRWAREAYPGLCMAADVLRPGRFPEGRGGPAVCAWIPSAPVHFVAGFARAGAGGGPRPTVRWCSCCTAFPSCPRAGARCCPGWRTRASARWRRTCAATGARTGPSGIRPRHAGERCRPAGAGAAAGAARVPGGARLGRAHRLPRGGPAPGGGGAPGGHQCAASGGDGARALEARAAAALLVPVLLPASVPARARALRARRGPGVAHHPLGDGGRRARAAGKAGRVRGELLEAGRGARGHRLLPPAVPPRRDPQGLRDLRSYPRIRAPFLLIWGDRDVALRASNTRGLERYFEQRPPCTTCPRRATSCRWRRRRRWRRSCSSTSPWSARPERRDEGWPTGVEVYDEGSRPPA